MQPLVVDKAHFEYLLIQRGEVSDAYKGGKFSEWKAAYEASLQAIYDSIAPVLPDRCGALLDVGSGLGGIDVVLGRRYGDVLVCTLDGVNDPPTVVSHAKPFSNKEVTIDFLKKNGIQRHKHYAPFTQKFDEKFDLVVSFASWAFHYPASDYAEQVKNALAPKAKVIVDVRRTKDYWLADMIHYFGRDMTVLDRGKKHVRVAWTT